MPLPEFETVSIVGQNQEPRLHETLPRVQAGEPSEGTALATQSQ